MPSRSRPVRRRQSAIDEKTRRIVETILAWGKNLRREVIAEGVETAQQAQADTEAGGASPGTCFTRRWTELGRFGW